MLPGQKILLDSDRKNPIEHPIEHPIGIPIGFPIGIPIGFPIGIPIGYPIRFWNKSYWIFLIGSYKKKSNRISP